MSRNEDAALKILNEIDRARAGGLSLDELESRIWRLLEKTDDSFPRILAGRVEEFVQELRRLESENIRWFGGDGADPGRGADVLFNEVTGALGRYLG